MVSKIFKRSIIKIVVFSAILAFFYFISIWQRYSAIISDSSSNFGYMDYQNNWRGLSDLTDFKVPFKDFYYEYGWFFLISQSPAFLLFGKNFLSVIISRELYLPVIGVLVSILLAKNFLRSNKLVFLFMFFALLFRINYDYTSLRHLMAELSLSFFALSLFSKYQKVINFSLRKTNLFIIAGILSGLSLLTSLEYGVALNLTILIIMGIKIIYDKNFLKLYLLKFLLPQSLTVLPFVIWLYINNALLNYWNFTYQFINNFYQGSPCVGESFPRIDQINILSISSRFLFLGLPVEWLQKLNFYIVLLFYLVVFIWSFAKFLQKRTIDKILIPLMLAIYGFLISVRTLINPCVGYFTYSLTPFFILLTLALKTFLIKLREKKFGFNNILLVLIIFWFTLTSTNEISNHILNKSNPAVTKKAEKKYYEPAGLSLESNLVKGYEEISEFINENTAEDDYVFVYPWGPYNSITGRKSPSSFSTNFQYITAGQEFTIKARKELETNMPKLVIINLNNAGGVARFGRDRDEVFDFISYKEEDGPVFSGSGNEAEWFILENYKTIKKYDLAIIMERRQKPINIRRKFKKIFSWPIDRTDIHLNRLDQIDTQDFKILGNKASIELALPEDTKATHAEIKLKLSGNLLEKYLGLFFANVYIKEKEKNDYHLSKTEILTRNWQEIKLGFYGKEKNIEKIKIEISENKGFAWWLIPESLKIQEIAFLSQEN